MNNDIGYIGMQFFKEPPPIEFKPALDKDTLRDVIDLSLWTGQLLLHYGADSQRIEETVHRLGTGLGANWLDILISPNALVITTTSGEEFRTKLRRVVGITVNMNVVDQINTLSRRVANKEIDRFGVRTELDRISKMGHYYHRFVVVVMVGLACAAFSRLFDGDVGIFFTTFFAASVAMFVRQELQRNYFHPLLTVAVTAFVAGCGASLAIYLSHDPQIALAASVLLLVPGVPLINATQDLIEGHVVTGLVRGVNGAIIVLMIALGLLLAIKLTGVNL